MIMYFADAHVGHRMYQSMTDDGITTAEKDTRVALDYLYERMQEPEIELVIFGGDLFNSSRPSAESIRWIIQWFKKVDALNKPLYLIPGNHDITATSNALVFLRSLHVSNIFLIDKSASKIAWNSWNIYFVPFMNPESSKNKYATTMASLSSVLQSLDKNADNIIVTHVQEVDSKIGAESMLFSRNGDIIDLGESTDQYKNTVVLSGHMHMPQAYQKANGIRVIYPGSTCSMDQHDCGQKKGYITFSKDGEIDFKPVFGTRLFKRYSLPTGKDPKEFFSSIRMSNNEVIFIELNDDTIVDESEIREYLQTRGCQLAKVLPKLSDDRNVSVRTAAKNPVTLLENWLKDFFKEEEKEVDWKNKVLPLGKEILLNETEFTGD